VQKSLVVDGVTKNALLERKQVVPSAQLSQNVQSQAFAMPSPLRVVALPKKAVDGKTSNKNVLWVERQIVPSALPKTSA
jgi:hypothetical protein